MKDVKRFLIVGVLLLSSVWAFDQAMNIHSSQTNNRKSNKVSPTVVDTRELVTKHLQMTNKRLELDQQQATSQNSFEMPVVGERLNERKDFPRVQGVPMNPDRTEHNAPHDLKLKKQLTFQTPGAEVQGHLRDQDDNEIANAELRTIYIQNFLENARRAGFEVRLNDDLVVTGVRRVNPEPSKSGTASPARTPSAAGAQ